MTSPTRPASSLFTLPQFVRFSKLVQQFSSISFSTDLLNCDKPITYQASYRMPSDKTVYFTLYLHEGHKIEWDSPPLLTDEELAQFNFDMNNVYHDWAEGFRIIH